MPFQIVRKDIKEIKADAVVSAVRQDSSIDLEKGTAILETAKDSGCLAKYVIRTAGMVWQGGDSGEADVIKNCYKAVFKIVADHEITSLALPLFAYVDYRFPKDMAIKAAISEIGAFLADHEAEIILVLPDEKPSFISSKRFGDIDAYIQENYVSATTDAKAKGRGHFSLNKCFSFSREAESTTFLGDMELAAPVGAAMAAKSLDDVVRNLDKAFMELVFSFADERGLTDVEVQKRANLDRKAFSKLKCGTTKNPSKATALALAVALELNLDDTKDLLSRAGLALSPCSKQDVIVQYFIEREAYDIYEINLALFEHGEPPIGTQIA